MNSYIGDNHLSPDHILARHWDDAYIAPYYPHEWDEIRWISEKLKTIAVEIQRKEDEKRERKLAGRIRIRTIQQVMGTITIIGNQKQQEENKKEQERQLIEAEKHRLVQESQAQIRTLSAIRNINGGPQKLIKDNLRSGIFSGKEDGFLIGTLLCYQISLRDMTKGRRKQIQSLIETLSSELESRGIPTDKASLESAYALIDNAKKQEYRKDWKIV